MFDYRSDIATVEESYNANHIESTSVFATHDYHFDFYGFVVNHHYHGCVVDHI